MWAPHLCLFEDHAGAADLEPLSLTRPVFDLLCGIRRLGEKQCATFAGREVGALVRPYLAELCQLQHPGLKINDPQWLQSAPLLLVNARWLPADGAAPHISGPCVGMVGDEVAFAALDPRQFDIPATEVSDECLKDWQAALPRVEAGGQIVRYLWDLVDVNGAQVEYDVRQGLCPVNVAGAPAHVAVVGPAEQVYLDPTAQVEPLVVLDTRLGPVVIDRGAVVTAFSRLEGPCYVGPESHVLGAKLRTGSSLGPKCRVGGEVEASILLGHANKYHDGFLGHSYVGEWVNFGAGTQNSDLRNDYGPITVTVNGRPVATGRTKVGCFVGDHTKTGLATLLNTGSSVGVFCNLLPGGLLPKHMPSFTSWWNEALVENSHLRQLLTTAETVMRRRDVPLTEHHAAVYWHLLDATSLLRRNALHDGVRRQLRRTA